MNLSAHSLCRRALLVGMVVALAGLALAGSAAAESRLYWTNNASGSIGSANRAGGEVVQKFFFASPEPYGIAADSTHVYWTDEGTDEIGRAELDGDNVEASLIPAAGEVPEGMAASGGYVYWANLIGQSIGRANLDGSDPEPHFIQLSAASFPEGVAVEGSHIYWTAAGHGGEIGRSNLAGGEIEEELITGLGGAISALAADSTHLYWRTNVGVGRAALDGTEANPNLVTGQTSVGGVAVDNEHVYWTSFTTNRIGRAELDGGTVEPAFITGAESPDTIAVSKNATEVSGDTSTASIVVGESLHATATVTGGEATSGTITFALYGPDDETCAEAPHESLVVSVAGDGSYESPAVAPSDIGTYHWVAEYSGDAINAPSVSACAEAAFTVMAPTPSTPASSAIDPSGPEVGALELIKVSRDRHSGKGRIRFAVPAAGKLTVSGTGVKTAARTAEGAGTVVIGLTPKGAYATRLQAHRRGFTQLTITFEPQGGSVVHDQRQVRLVRSQ